MPKKNLILLLGAVVIIGAFLFFKFRPKPTMTPDSEVAEGVTSEGGQTESAPGDQEKMSEKVLDMGPDQKSTYDDSKRVFSLIAEDSAACLEVKTGNFPDDAPVNLDSFVMHYSRELGPAAPRAEKSSTWVMKSRDGQEMRIRVENRYDEEGQTMRTLEFFKMGDDGIPIVQELDPELGINPTQETIDRLLSEGDLQYREQAGFVNFPGGDRLDFVERDGQLTEIEFVKGDRFFRCSNIRERESCQCLK